MVTATPDKVMHHMRGLTESASSFRLSVDSVAVSLVT